MVDSITMGGDRLFNDDLIGNVANISTGLIPWTYPFEDESADRKVIYVSQLFRRNTNPYEAM